LFCLLYYANIHMGMNIDTVWRRFTQFNRNNIQTAKRHNVYASHLVLFLWYAAACDQSSSCF
jgi:hypothetical protein